MERIREDSTHDPSGYSISDDNSGWDNFYNRNIQAPNTQEPSSAENTIENYDRFSAFLYR